MSNNYPGINGRTTIIEAIEILKRNVETIARSAEATEFYQQSDEWSKLFREAYKPHKQAVAQYEQALEINEWLNGKNSSNCHLPIQEVFLNLSDQERLSLFKKLIDTDVPGIFDCCLKAWWENRY